MTRRQKMTCALLSLKRGRGGFVVAAISLNLFILATPSVSAASRGEISLFQTVYQNQKADPQDVTPLVRLANGRFRVRPSAKLPALPVVTFDPSVRYHKTVGYGAALTEAAVIAINTLRPERRQTLLERVFDARKGAGFSFLRIPVGASDFIDRDAGFYSYDDPPDGLPDPDLKHFSMARDQKTLELLKEIKRINPELRVMLSAWSAPPWMKYGGNGYINGLLYPMYEGAYARYLRLVVEKYESEGIPVHAMTVVNEPFYFDNFEYISMPMSLEQQIRMIGKWLGPELRGRGLRTRILALDHNYNLTPEATKLVESPVAGPYLGGVAFHCYGGDPSDTDVLSRAHPEVRFYSTECTSLVDGHRFKTDIGGWLNALVLKPTMSSFLAWNLALFTPGRRPSGFQNCPECLGYITVDPETRDFRIEPELFATQHASQFIRAGARPLATIASAALNLKFLAAVNRDGSHVLIVNNRNAMPQAFRLRNEQGESFDFKILPMSVVTMTWR